MSQANKIQGLMLNGRTGRVIVYTDGIDRHLDYKDCSLQAQEAINKCLAELQVLINSGNLYRPAKSAAQAMITTCDDVAVAIEYKQDSTPF